MSSHQAAVIIEDFTEPETGENPGPARGTEACLYNSKLRVQGMDCADCAARLEKRLSRVPGVESIEVNFATANMNVIHRGPLEEIVHAVEKMGYYASSAVNDRETPPVTGLLHGNPYAFPTLAALIFLLLGAGTELFGAPPAASAALLGAAVIVGGFRPARAGWLTLVNTRELDMNTLMVVAVLGAWAIGQLEEAATVVFLFSLGNALQGYTLDRTRMSIKSLMELAPNEALLRREEGDYFVPVDELNLGDIVVVKPGARIPMDGRVAGGQSAVNQAPITGESLPVEKAAGDQVFAGTVNGPGLLEIEVTRLAGDNTVARIIHLVETAQAARAPSQQLVDRFAAYYTPAVLGAALLVAVIPPLLGGGDWKTWFYESLSMLLIACPCALVISTPVSIVAALGSAARSGVLIKGGAFLEAMGSVSVVAFDKTGTLTAGQLKVAGIRTYNGASEKELLAIAGALESNSEHPLAAAVIESARAKGLALPRVDSFVSVPGQGASGEVMGRMHFIGSPRWLEERGLDVEAAAADIKSLQETGKTVILVSGDEKLLGLLAVSDAVRPGARRAVERLKTAGIGKTVMLTGDNCNTAAVIAGQAGIDEYMAGLLPEGKVEAVNKLLTRHGHVAMVGDGVNDAPAMAAATVGIAMGTAGTDAALETADIALMADDLQKLEYTVRLSRRTRRTIKQNLALALLIKAAVLLMVIPGWLTLWLAVAADVGSSLLVTLNGMRLLHSRHHA